MSEDAWIPIPEWPGYEGTLGGRLRNAKTRRELSPSGLKRTYTLKGGGLSTTATAGGVAARAAAAAGVAPREAAPAPEPEATPWPPPGCRLDARAAAALEEDRRRHRMAVAMRGNGCDWIPSPDEIRAACAAIRSEWDPVQEANRRGHRVVEAEAAMLGCRLDRVFRRNGRPCSRRAS